jgi:type IV pilus assembly protein PilW
MKKYVMEMTNKRGYTIVDLLVAIAISGIFMGAIYSAYTSQQKSTLAQEQVSSMQRNLRSAMYFMEKEIRMAGCDPTSKAGAGITTANVNTISFTEDGDGDGAVTSITYGIAGANLLRNTGRIAENIDAINFVYLDRDGTRLDDDTNGNVIYDDSMAQIRSIQVTVVARTGKEDPRYTDSTTYVNKLGETIFTPAGDDVHFRRKVLRTSITCRNLGL